MSKPFTTYDQQLKILRKRGLLITNPVKAKRILESENYYCVINGYNDLFLDKGYIPPAGSEITERYLSNTHFNDIYSLYMFDKELKQLFLNVLLNFENYIKSLLAYYFSKETKKKGNAAYLDFNNYDPEKRNETLGLISNLFTALRKYGHKDNSLKHYLENHDEVPLWVLVNILTLGNTSSFYSCCRPTVKSNITKHLQKDRSREYRGYKKTIYNDELEKFLGACTYFRNICAHDNRFYNSEYHYNFGGKNKRMTIFALLLSLKNYIPKHAHQRLSQQVTDLKTHYIEEFTDPSKIDEIYRMMGYPKQ